MQQLAHQRLFTLVLIDLSTILLCMLCVQNIFIVLVSVVVTLLYFLCGACEISQSILFFSPFCFLATAIFFFFSIFFVPYIHKYIHSICMSMLHSVPQIYLRFFVFLISFIPSSIYCYFFITFLLTFRTVSSLLRLWICLLYHNLFTMTL